LIKESVPMFYATNAQPGSLSMKYHRLQEKCWLRPVVD